MRTVICGGPRTGKTTLAASLPGPIKHTDDLILDHDWSAASEAASSWFDEPGPWLVEGVTAVRALRKWLAAHPGHDKPCDLVIWLYRQHELLTKGQATMAKGCLTVWREIEPELNKRLVRVQVGE